MDDIKDLRYGLPSLILRQLVQPLDHRLHFLLAEKLLNKFFCISLNRVRYCLTDEGLTESSLFYLFGCQRECGEQFHEYFNNHLVHSVCRRDLGIDFEAIEEVSNRLEQFGQSIVVGNNVLDRLIRLNVENMCVRER